MVLALFGFALVTQLGAAWLALCVVVYAWSLRICGRRLAADALRGIKR
ncbi:MAG TPA: hypothetical protein VKS01_06920 [Bryobacteraceae bacterium]|nr:hypothetical protein [Bryobacteraceae bacterium]